MKIALLGYGKMGKVIEQIALQRGHSIVLKKSSTDTFLGIETADVAIDFSVPQSAVENITYCLQNNIPVVSGTTGWLDHYDTMVDLCKAKNGAFIYGSNFSLGVNLFFELNAYLAKMMSKFKDYHVSMEEIHHTQKLDKPSGTAISLAKDIIANAVYAALVLPIAARELLSRRLNRGLVSLGGGVAASAVVSSLVFYLVTNAAVWHAALWYPRSCEGVIRCYTATLPFLGYALAGDLLFSLGLFGAYALALRLTAAPQTTLATTAA